MTELKLGRSNVDITPPIGLHLAGWAGERYSDGIHQPLSCRVLSLENDAEAAVLVSLDLLGMSASLVTEIRQMAQERTGIPSRSIMLASTHTHSGPLLPPWWTPESPPDPRYIDDLKRKVVGAIAAAGRDPQPVTVGFGRGSSDLGVSRRLVSANGTVEYPPRADPTGTVDPEVGVMRFDSPEGDTQAVLFGYGCHPTVAGPSRWIGPDYPGEARRLVESFFPGSMAFFLLGNCGDVRSNFLNPDGTFRWDASMDLVEQAGVRVGAEVLRVAVQIRPERHATLATTHVFADIYMTDGEVAETCEFQAFRVGPAAIVTNPGECFAQIGLDVRKEFETPIIFSSVTNGLLGYVPTRDAYRHGGYEVATSYSSFGLANPIRDDGEIVFRQGMSTALAQCLARPGAS